MKCYIQRSDFFPTIEVCKSVKTPLGNKKKVRCLNNIPLVILDVFTQYQSLLLVIYIVYT